VVQWLIIIAIVAVCLRIFFRPVPAPDRSPETWRSWEGFYALSYGAIMRHPTGVEVSSSLLRNHLEALRDAGYKTVTPDDLAHYADGRHALPEKALLLMFEGGRKDSVLNVTPLLRELGFVAVACLNTGACESRDRFYLSSSELNDLARQPHWYLGSMGHQAMSHLSNSPQGRENAHFLTSRKQENGVSEEDTAFVNRVMQDYATSANFLGSLSGRSPVLFLYPYTDRGLGSDADPLAGRINRMAVELLYRLAFVDGSEPFNGLTRDRYALTRLRVDGRLTASALLDRLARSKPRTRTSDSPVLAVDWMFSPKARDLAAQRESGDSLTAVELQDGMSAWVKGSEDWSDSHISAKVRFDPEAVAGIYARYTDPEQCLYLSVAPTGIRLQERRQPGIRVTLGDHKATLKPGREYQVRLTIKRNRAFVFLDGQIIGQSLPLRTVEGHGRCGIGSNTGTSSFSGVKAGPLPVVFVVANEYRSLPAALRESALAFLPELPVVEKQAETSAGAVCVDQSQVDEMIAAAAEGVEPIPLVNTAVSPSATSAETCTRLGDIETLKPVVRRLGLRGVGSTHKPRDLAERRLPPVRVLQSNQVRDWLDSSKDAGQEIVLVEGSASEVLRSTDLLLLKIPPHRLVAGSVRPSELPPGVGLAVYPRSPK